MDIEQPYTLISDRLQHLLKERFGAYFTTYYIGTPEQIPESALPALIIQTVRGGVDTDATMTDVISEETIINIVANAKDGFAAGDDNDNVMRQLQILVQKIDPATGSFSDSSILGVLRHKLTIDSTVIENSIRWDYGQNPRYNQDNDPLPSLCEAVISVTTTQRVFVTNRT